MHRQSTSRARRFVPIFGLVMLWAMIESGPALDTARGKSPEQSPGQSPSANSATQAAAPVTQPVAGPAVRPALPLREDPIKTILDELSALREEVVALRSELAAATLRAESCERQAAELRQFIADHDEYGEDFSQYQAVKAEAEKEARRKAAEEARQRREQQRSERQARMQAARAEKAQRDAEAARVARYRRDGFSPLGLDVYISRTAFFYQSQDQQSQTRIDYDPFIGTYLRPINIAPEVDYSRMTISGSVLNAADEVRNLGIAITFFDANGNQVGHEIVQLNNARPNVPYPFTSTIEMALNGPFDTSSTYVLYADPVSEE